MCVWVRGLCVHGPPNCEMFAVPRQLQHRKAGEPSILLTFDVFVCLLCSLRRPDNDHVVQAGLQLAAILLPQNPECWDYKCPSPFLALNLNFGTLVLGVSCKGQGLGPVFLRRLPVPALGLVGTQNILEQLV